MALTLHQDTHHQTAASDLICYVTEEGPPDAEIAEGRVVGQEGTAELEKLRQNQKVLTKVQINRYEGGRGWG